MFRITTKAGFLKLAIGAAAIAVAGLASVGPSEAYDGRRAYGYERPAHGWRPPPPVAHGYWGHRQWRRHHDGYGYGPRPFPRDRYGWR